MTRRSAARAAAMAALALLPSAAASQAPSPWRAVLRGEDGTTVSIDSAAVTHSRDSAFIVRTAIRFPELVRLPGGRAADHEIDLEELDCGGGRSRALASGLFLDTVAVTAVELSRTWAPVAENRRAVFDASCGWLLGSPAAALPTGYALGDLDEPPELTNRPTVARALSRGYPGDLREKGVTGNVTVSLRVTEQGLVDTASIRVETSDHEGFSASARDVVRIMEFRPARVQGSAVAVWVTLPVSYQLRETVWHIEASPFHPAAGRELDRRPEPPEVPTPVAPAIPSNPRRP